MPAAAPDKLGLDEARRHEEHREGFVGDQPIPCIPRCVFGFYLGSLTAAILRPTLGGHHLRFR